MRRNAWKFEEKRYVGNQKSVEDSLCSRQKNIPRLARDADAAGATDDRVLTLCEAH